MSVVAARQRTSDAVEAVGVDLALMVEMIGEDGAANDRTKMGPFSSLLLAYGDVTGRMSNGFQLCTSILEHFIDLEAKSRRLGLYAGWTGLGWVTTHLEADEDFVGVHVDRLLRAQLAAWPPRAGYDLISGLVGTGVFFLERLPADSAVEGITLVMDALEDCAVETDSGTTWFTSPDFLPESQRRQAPNGYYNLGVAHGAPGVIGLLGRICAEGIAVGRAESLMQRNLAWVRAQQPNPRLAELPSWIAPGVSRRPNRRMAWCYGPLGAAAVVLRAARTIGDCDSEQWAETLARACAHVVPSEGLVRDPGLCHGAAGNMHMFRRLHQYTGEAVFQSAADAWLEATLAYRSPGVGVGGFRSWMELESGELGWTNDASFLSGSAGVGLALLAAITEGEPNWDRLLLLS